LKKVADDELFDQIAESPAIGCARSGDVREILAIGKRHAAA
jgi:hypothetical protein